MEWVNLTSQNIVAVCIRLAGRLSLASTVVFIGCFCRILFGELDKYILIFHVTAIVVLILTLCLPELLNDAVRPDDQCPDADRNRPHDTTGVDSSNADSYKIE